MNIINPEAQPLSSPRPVREPLPWQACLAEAARKMGYSSAKDVPLTSPINDRLVKLAHEVRNGSMR